MQIATSLHQMLRDTVSGVKHLNDPFLYVKEEGDYRPITYATVFEKLNAVSAYLLKSGLNKGDRFAMLLENCPEYLITDQALMQLGCVNVSIYPTLPESDVEYILSDSGARGILVGNPFLLRKVMKATANDNRIEIILINFEKSKAGKDPRIVSLHEDIFPQSTEIYTAHHDAIEERFHSVNKTDLASLIYTSGTTGVPKGVMLTHENFMSNAWMVKTLFKHIYPGDRYLSFLPLCHVYERLATYYLSTYIGCEIAFAQGIESISANMIEVKPTIMTTVPRLLERVKERVIKNAESQGETKKKIFYWAQEVGRKRRELKEKGHFINPLLAARYALADRLVFRKVKARLGGRMRLLVSGGAALPQHVGEFFGNMGIRALEGFGLTETSPLIAVHEYERQLYGTVGRVAPGLRVGILNVETGQFISEQTYDSFDPDFECAEGEIVVKGPSVMKGYWNKPEETKAVIDEEGWFHTGDIGKFYKGYLKITDRLKNMLVNAYGKNIYPTPVENLYLRSNRIDQIFLIGDRREFITAIIVPAKDELKERFDLKEEFFEDTRPFISEPEILAWVREDILKLSNDLAKYERIKDFILKRNPFTLEAGEITPTLKTKRKVIEEKFSREIEAMYEGAGED